VIEDVPEQIEVLNHRGKNLITKRAREKEIYKPRSSKYAPQLGQ
jgi:hypothetical protein